VTFSVTVVSLESVTYQWYFGGSAIPGATGGSYTISKATTKNAGSYSVTCANGVGTTPSGAATLTVVDTPPVAHNDSYSVVENTLRTVSASAGVLANDTDANGDALTAVLATNVTHGTLNLGSSGGFTYLSATNFVGTDVFYYRANDGASNSSVASVTLTVLAPPSITSQPQNQAAIRNSQVTFSVGVAGTSPFHYQWYFQNNLLSGSTNSTYTDSQVQNKDLGSYFVVVTNVAGAVTSAVATLSLGAAPDVSTLGASNLTTNSATLIAAVNPQGYAAAYAFLYGVTTNYNFVSATNSLPATNANLSATISISGLNPGTTYHFCAVATNAGGISLGTDMVLTTPYLPPTATTLTASNVTASSAVLTATVNPQGSATACAFLYGLTTDYGFATATNSLPATNANLSATIPVSGLNPGTTYHFCAVATNAGGVTVGSDMILTTPYLPPSATTLAASDVTAGSATFNAAINPQGTTAGYYFKYGVTTNYGSFTATNTLPAGTNDAAVSVPVAGLNAGTIYHYKVVAINSGGTTIAPRSTFSTLSIPSMQFTGTTVNQGGQQYMQLALTSVSGASFTVIGSTNLLLPAANWTVIGSMTETSPGQYQFTDPQPATNSMLFYRIQTQ
jgi:hypothetical protein